MKHGMNIWSTVGSLTTTVVPHHMGHCEKTMWKTISTEPLYVNRRELPEAQ